MHVIAHDYIRINRKAFESDSIIHCVNHDIPVSFPGENINPVNDLQSHEISCFLFVNFVCLAHDAGWIRLLFLKTNKIEFFD